MYGFQAIYMVVRAWRGVSVQSRTALLRLVALLFRQVLEAATQHRNCGIESIREKMPVNFLESILLLAVSKLACTAFF